MENFSQSGQHTLEREYYFDEGLGESLEEHTASLRSQFPDMSIETRRDKDGIPIVKLSMRPQYKYPLEQFESADMEKLLKLQEET